MTIDRHDNPALYVAISTLSDVAISTYDAISSYVGITSYIVGSSCDDFLSC